MSVRSESATVLLFVATLLQTCSGLLSITAHHGENITLPCWTSSSKPFIAVEWTRSDLTSPIFFSMDRHSYKHRLDASFVDRVIPLDRQMRDGNLSVMLKNVSSADAGTYECRVKVNETRRRRNIVIGSEPISVVILTVTGPLGITKDGGQHGEGGNPDENSTPLVALKAGLSAAAAVVFIVVLGIIIFIKTRKVKPKHSGNYVQNAQTIL